eukprot:GHVR01153194.1.p1 GENE.GHVR01153194.1~~GHVR01153194.1.p1  ORF type:complete len:129 (-),score=2.10 GHVR01153194.1:2491-2877(-)
MLIHDQRINYIHVNSKANLVCTSGKDGKINLINLYSNELFWVYENICGGSVSFCCISTSPLYCVIFYSKEDNKVYCYSINGQLLSQVDETTGFIYNMAALRSSDSTECIVILINYSGLFKWSKRTVHS